MKTIRSVSSLTALQLYTLVEADFLLMGDFKLLLGIEDESEESGDLDWISDEQEHACNDSAVVMSGVRCNQVPAYRSCQKSQN